MADYREADVLEQTDKTVLITGANTGIGYDTARVLAERGANVLLGCRSEEKANEAIHQIKSIKADAKVRWISLDLSNLSSIKKAADQVNREEHLDILINNAGVMIPPKSTTADGFELQFGVNHLGHFALTAHLLNKLKSQLGARIVNVSSLAHRQGIIDFEDIHSERSYNRIKRYAMSKFANILFTYELQRRLHAANSPAISVACHPGGSKTELDRHVPFPFSLLFMPLSLIMNTSAEGALPTLMASTVQGVEGGDYFGPKKLGEMAHSAHKVDTIPSSKDEALAKKLWKVSSELTGVAYTF